MVKDSVFDMKTIPPRWGWDIVIPLLFVCGLFGYMLYWAGVPTVWAMNLAFFVYYGISIKHGQV